MERENEIPLKKVKITSQAKQYNPKMLLELCAEQILKKLSLYNRFLVNNQTINDDCYEKIFNQLTTQLTEKMKATGYQAQSITNLEQFNSRCYFTADNKHIVALFQQPARMQIFNTDTFLKKNFSPLFDNPFIEDGKLCFFSPQRCDGENPTGIIYFINASLFIKYCFAPNSNTPFISYDTSIQPQSLKGEITHVISQRKEEGVFVATRIGNSENIYAIDKSGNSRLIFQKNQLLLKELFSNSKDQLIAIDTDGCIRIIDSKKKEIINKYHALFDQENPEEKKPLILSIALNPKGDLIAVSFNNGLISFCNIENGTYTTIKDKINPDNFARINFIDNDHIITIREKGFPIFNTTDKKFSLEIWNLAGKKIASDQHTERDRSNSLIFDTNLEYLVIGSSKYDVSLRTTDLFTFNHECIDQKLILKDPCVFEKLIQKKSLTFKEKLALVMTYYKKN